MVVTTANSTYKPKDTELEIKNKSQYLKCGCSVSILCLSLFGADSMIRLKLHIRKALSCRICRLCNLVGMSCPCKVLVLVLTKYSATLFQQLWVLLATQNHSTTLQAISTWHGWVRQLRGHFQARVEANQCWRVVFPVRCILYFSSRPPFSLS